MCPFLRHSLVFLLISCDFYSNTVIIVISFLGQLCLTFACCNDIRKVHFKYIQCYSKFIGAFNLQNWYLLSTFKLIFSSLFANIRISCWSCRRKFRLNAKRSINEMQVVFIGGSGKRFVYFFISFFFSCKFIYIWDVNFCAIHAHKNGLILKRKLRCNFPR